MKTLRIYAAGEGWVYEVWIDSRPRVVGFSRTREDAEREGRIA